MQLQPARDTADWGPGVGVGSLESKRGKGKEKQMVSAKRRLLSHDWVRVNKEEVDGLTPCMSLKGFFSDVPADNSVP